jgi:RNA polymerase sigma-70 factor (family 1)
VSIKPLYNEYLLFDKFRAGDGEAFACLYRHYVKALYFNILSMVKDELTAEELVQDVFAHLWSKRETIRIESSLSAYLFTSSRNRVYNFFRKLERDQELYKRIRSTAALHYSHIEEALMAGENAKLLRKAIETLPPQRRKAFELCKIEGLSYQEASEKMGVSLSTIKDHMANARQAIRTFLSNEEIAVLALLFTFLHGK